MDSHVPNRTIESRHVLICAECSAIASTAPYLLNFCISLIRRLGVCTNLKCDAAVVLMCSFALALVLLGPSGPPLSAAPVIPMIGSWAPVLVWGRKSEKGHESQQHVAGGLNRTDDVGGANAVRDGCKKRGKERNRTNHCESMELCTDALPVCG